MKLTIKTRLIGGFAIILILIIVSSLVDLDKLYEMDERINHIVNISAEKVRLAGVISKTAIAISRAEKNMILSDKQDERDVHIRSIKEKLRKMEEKIRELYNLTDEVGKARLTEFSSLWSEYIEINNKVRELAVLNSTQAFKLSSGKGRKISDRAIGLMEDIIDKNETDMVDDKKASDDSSAAARNFMIGIMVTSLSIALVASITNIRAILIPLDRLKEAVSEIGKGRLDINLKISQQNEIGKVTASFNKMVDDLQRITVSKNYVDNIINAMSESLVVLSPDTRINRVNKAILDMLGYREEELIGQPVDILFTEEDLKKVDFDNLINSSSVFSNESAYISRQGKTIPVILSASPMKDNLGAIEGLVSLAVDISNRKKMQSALRQSEKMASIGRLAAGIAHEINNPLTNVSLNIQELINSDINNKILQEIKAIDRNIERASTIIKELLQFCWQGETEFIPVDMNETIKSAFTLLRFMLKSVRIDQKLTDIPDVIGDPIKLEQVLINILHNAIGAMPDGGDILISTSYSEGRVKLEISDSGEGIKKEDLSKVFDPFFTTKEIGKGTGLGLSICYGIIRQHKGTVEVSSKRREGTTITISLPTADNHDKNSYS